MQISRDDITMERKGDSHHVFSSGPHEPQSNHVKRTAERHLLNGVTLERQICLDVHVGSSATGDATAGDSRERPALEVVMRDTYDEWKAGVYLDDETEDAEEICATCAEQAEMTHVSPLGERICRRCGESGDWSADGMDDPEPIRS